jgi:homoserine O-acetyltransferase
MSLLSSSCFSPRTHKLQETTARLTDVNVAALPGQHVRLGPLVLDSGATLDDPVLAYQTYGQLAPARDNAILICHALTGDQFVAGTHPVTGKPGWWADVVGPGKLIDTDRYYVICCNVLGGCMGSEGPASLNPRTGQLWGLDFPVVTVHDMVRAEAALLDHLGLQKLFMVIGGSMGGMQALSWAVQFPERVGACMALATASRHTAQNIALHEVGRRAIRTDPAWAEGRYAARNTTPDQGLAVARMIAHITYLSEEAFQRKFGRCFQEGVAPAFQFEPDFQVESYLQHQGDAFVRRFDANSYLYITRALDYFDLAVDAPNGDLAAAFGPQTPPCFLASFTSDWLYPTSESRRLVTALSHAGVEVSFAEIVSDKGHDAFLLDEPALHRAMKAFLDGQEKRRLKNPPLSTPEIEIVDRPTFAFVAEAVAPGDRVLDIGCGDGSLLLRLQQAHALDAHGIDIDVGCVAATMGQGLPAIAGDANKDLTFYADDSFDLAILTNTLSELHDPRATLRQLRRIARRSVVSVANFAHYKAIARLAFGLRAPVTDALPNDWTTSPNIRFCTLRDFRALVRDAGLRIVFERPLTDQGHPLPRLWAGARDLLAAQSLFLLEKEG